MSEIKHSQGQREPLLSQRRKFPEVFRWKVAAIIISVLIAIFLVVDIILLVHYNNSLPRKINHTFLADLLDYSTSQNDQFTTQQFANMATALATSYHDLWFQSASLVQMWAAPPLTLDNIGSFFNGDSTDNQLFVLTMSDGTNTVLGAAFSHIGFPLPSGDWQSFLLDPTHDYYTFEITDRQSVLLGGSSQNYLRMSGSTADLRNCKVIDLTSSTLSFLELVSLNFSSPAGVTANLAATNTNSICFDGQPTPTSALTTLQSLFGVAMATLTVTKIEVFHLST